jgi:hypothetical protein
VIRADTVGAFVDAFERLRALLRSTQIRAERSEAHRTVLVEGFISGSEYALEGVLERGALHTLAIFDKPDPLNGPFFEESIYVTPSSAPEDVQRGIVNAVARAAAAIGLDHGPIHAECRVNDEGVFVLEVAARPIGGLCARALRFDKEVSPRAQAGTAHRSRPLEELLIRHALGESLEGWTRELSASGVMMIPIPGRAIFRRVEGLDRARRIAGIDDLQITAKPDQLLVPLPEGASYLGFIFARALASVDVVRSLREAHDALHIVVDIELPVIMPA